MSLEEYLAELADPNKRLAISQLAKLSDLSPQQLKLFQKAWAEITTERRCQVASQLVLLAEDNFQLHFDSIFKICLEDSEPAVRAKAIEGLWECEEPSLISRLVKLLQEDTDEKIRSVAAIALGKFSFLGELEELRPRYTKQVQEALLSVIDNAQETLEVRRRAVEAISYFSLPRVKEIIQKAYNSGEVKMRVSALFAMGRNGDIAWFPFLTKELEAPDPEIRSEAARACGELGEEKAVSYLSHLISDADREVQLVAIEAIGRIGGKEAKEILRRWSQYPDKQIRQAVEEAWEEAQVQEEFFSFGLGSKDEEE